jgi:uncharacterized protein (DUF305 family)
MLRGSGAIALIAIALLATTVVVAAARMSARHDEDEAAFFVESNAAMSKMMAAMTVKPSGDVDADFVASMVPHHQGAIEMARAELRYGHNEQLRRIAQEIIIDQTQEIAAMRQALGQPLPDPAGLEPDPASLEPESRR